jgi:NADH dehydrogenase [ubiquinone] 1 alpha subcomplex assembly factor 2
LVGSDLSGTTFWEFRDDIRAGRWRRIAKYPRSTHHADVKLSRKCLSSVMIKTPSNVRTAQWIQWLRHTRHEAPSIQEQQYEVSRRAMMKQLAAEADERWKSTPRYIDGPERQQPASSLAINETEKPSNEQSEVGDAPGVMDGAIGNQEDAARTSEETVRRRRQREDDPWQRPQTGAPSERWQPETWAPTVVQRR